VLFSRAFHLIANALHVDRSTCVDLAARWRSPQILPGIAAAVIGVALSVTAWLAVAAREDRVAELEFSARATNHALLLQSQIDDYMEKVVALRALFQSSEGEVSRAEFTQFTQSLLHGHSAILAFSWLPRVTEAERDAHERAARHDGLSSYRIKSAAALGDAPPAARTGEHFPIYYSNQGPAGAPPYGLDLNDGGLRQQTLERARDNDRLATSPVFTLRSGAGDRTGFFVTLPVYRRGLPHNTLEERRDNLVGYAQGVFQIGVLIETILTTATTPGGLDLYFFVPSSGSEPRPIYFHSSRARAHPTAALSRAALMAGQHWSKELHIGDADWTLVATPIPGSASLANRGGSWSVLAGGLSFTVLLVSYLWAAGRHEQRLQAANRQLDRTLAQLARANGEALAQNLRFDTALNNMSQGLVMFDSVERLVVCNERYIEMYGMSREIVKPGCSFIDLLRHRYEAGNFPGDPEADRARILDALSEGVTTDFLIAGANGREIAVAARTMAGGGWVATHEDVTERRCSEAKIAYMARHDALTDLPNRVRFHEQLTQALSGTTRGKKLAVLCLDIDRFKGVNDTLGHPIGDILLRIAAERLRACTRDTDAVARLGGDEFAIVQLGASQPEDATTLATRLIETISAPYDLDGHQVVVGLSIGIAIAPDDGAQPHQLLKSADMALYRAKADGRGVYRFFEAEMDARMQTRRTLELDLRAAVVNGEFELFYQPLVDTRTERVRGLEALIRWRHPRQGLVPPLEFIPLAEETGLIVPIGEWALHQACREAATWPDDVSVAVNLSPIQFKSKNLVPMVITALARAGLSPHRLELEITESVLMNESETTLAMLHQLRDLGVRISMDDFGTGYSSLGYLRKFPFDKIKIDRSFIRDMSDREDSLAIVRAVAAMGTSLGMATTAEGVETRDQLEQLRKEGCTEVQGYLFSRPRPAAEIRELLDALAPRLKAIA
jgi:diguanylate cyclase (GGDEF)-like protein